MRPGFGRGGVKLGCSLRLGPLGEFGLGRWGAFGRVNQVSSVVRWWIVWFPTIPGVTLLTCALSGSGVSTSITLPAGLRVLRVGDAGC